MWQVVAAVVGRRDGCATGVQGKKAVSACCFARAATAGTGRSAMYGGGICQMSVRRRWDERVGCEVIADEGECAVSCGEVVGVARLCAVAYNSRKCWHTVAGRRRHAFADRYARARDG